MMGYFSILAAIPGFFLSSLILMALWGVIAPKFAIDTIKLPHGHARNDNRLADGSAAGGGWPEEQEVETLNPDVPAGGGGSTDMRYAGQSPDCVRGTL